MSKKISSLVMLVVYMVVYLNFVVEALFRLESDDVIGFTLVAFYFVMPLLSLACGVVWGLFIKNPLKWLFVLVAAVLECLLARIAFGSNDLVIDLVPACMALIGLSVGDAIRVWALKDRKKKKRMGLQA